MFPHVVAIALLSSTPSTSVDFNSVLRLVGYETGAHGCPVTEHLIITARHVAYDDEDRPRSYRFDTRDGTEGVVSTVSRVLEADLAVMYTEERLRPYPIADNRLAPGEKVRLLGFDWRDEDRAYGERVFGGEVTRILAGNFAYKNPGQGGSSGTCVFNEKGEVAGINSGTKGLQNQSVVGFAVGIWGRWKPKLLMPANHP